MKTARLSAYQLLLSASVLSALFVFVAFMPQPASALSVNAQTVQLLPPGANTCAPIQVSNFTPYIYDGALNSFEFTVSDPAYVAVVGSVGQSFIPLRYITRFPDASGGIRMHIDTDTTALTSSVPVTVTLLSARTGEPVCASVITVDLGTGMGYAGPVTPAPVYPTAPKPEPTSGSDPVTHPMSSSSGTVASSAPTSSAVQNPLKNLCVSDASAYRLWLILLVIYTLVVGGLLWLEFPISSAWVKTPERVASSILVLLVLILGFWYLSTSCRAALWMPLLAFLIAVLGLLAAFWNHPRVTQLLLLEEKSTTIITPPPKK